MIQFNLLPDVKNDYIKTRRTKHVVLVSAFLAAAVSLGVLILLVLVVDGLQKKHLHDVNSDIKTYTKQLQDTPDLTKILTIQNQLKSLPGLDNQKPVTSRLIGYLGQVVPNQVNINSLDVDFTKSTIEFTGSTDSLDRINTFADTLKFTTYTTGTDTAGKAAFTGVVLSSFSPKLNNNATYTITASFDPAIFNATQSATLVVPANKITTRSQTNQPSAALFTTPTKAQ